MTIIIYHCSSLLGSLALCGSPCHDKALSLYRMDQSCIVGNVVGSISYCREITKLLCPAASGKTGLPLHVRARISEDACVDPCPICHMTT